MVVFDLLGRRGAMRILWELRGEPLTFRRLQDAAQTNPALLNTRLAELREAGIVAHEGGYRLTADGSALLVAMQPIGAWAERWGRRASAAPARRAAQGATAKLDA